MLETLLRRAAAERASARARADVLRTEILALVRGHLPAGGRAWLIGSLAWGEFGNGSDVDLVFDGVDPARLVQIETDVARAAGAAVDVLLLDELPASFRARVEREGTSIHGA